MKKTLHKYFGTKKIKKIFPINASIVEVIIREMLWDPEDIKVQMQLNLMACFQDVAEDSEKLTGG